MSYRVLFLGGEITKKEKIGKMFANVACMPR
jgi:hypothetical protein